MTRAAALCSHSVLIWEWYLLVLGATFCVCLAMIEQTALSQQNGKIARLKKSDSDLSICGDTESTGNKTEAVVLWKATPPSECRILIDGQVESLPQNLTGYLLTSLKPTRMYNVTVSCIESNYNRRGEVSLKTGEHYSSSECTSADWLIPDDQDTANVTLCLEPLDGFALLVFNATTPMENCFLANSSQPAAEAHIHLLPYTSTVHVSTPNTSFSIRCVDPPSEGFQTDQLTYIQDSTETVCITKMVHLEAPSGSTPDPAGPSIHRVRPQFLSAHVGLFVLLLICTIAVIGILTVLVVKRIRVQHRRQGQRLLVNEDEAAFRDLQEMET